ncbi:IkappaB kinase complex, IKAP component [Phaffia rhodozyma]|uniref:Elongator complex protein 1 n=1 Tax=Phaffia rhodozyma TaxID=264483 RepID=A0A0F7ST86_PHARH|nr:IkappaB kinase complex, IKAP component [Phaffia rhodozyma]
MRSLACLSSIARKLPSAAPDSRSSSCAFNPETGAIYVAVESAQPQGSIELELVAIEGPSESDVLSLATYIANPSPSAKHRFPHLAKQVLCIEYLGESQSLCVILASGELISYDLTGDSQLEVVGVVDAGIKAAEWSPDEELLIVITGDDKLLQMTKDFDVLADSPLRSKDFGEDKAINVGWGSKETQFHGSAGKAAAQQPKTNVSSEKNACTPDDDETPRISWRGDGAHFAISTLDPTSSNAARRVIRTYSRMAALQSTSEAISGLEHQLAWQPSGSLIASTQRFGTFEGAGEGREGRHDVVFFERNGLRHGEFELREVAGKKRDGEGRGWAYRVRELGWNCDSSLLSVWIEGDDNEGDVVQIWTRNNYHWYLKQEITSLSLHTTRFTSVQWHPEEPFKIATLTPDSLEIRSFIWDTYGSVIPAPNDTGMVSVVDGASLLITPFRTQNVPPPMSSNKIINSHEMDSRKCIPPIHVAYSPAQDILAQLYPSGAIELHSVRTKLDRSVPGRAQVIEPVISFSLPEEVRARQVALVWEDEKKAIAVLGWDAKESRDSVWIKQDKEEEWQTVSVGSSGMGKLIAGIDGFILEDKTGQVSAISFDGDLMPFQSFLPTFCPTLRLVTHESTTLLIALSPLGKLFAMTPVSSEVYSIASNSTSFGLSADYLIYTTTTHESKYAPLTILTRILDGGYIVSEQEKVWEERRVERGAIVVTVVSSSNSLVLQMPRGNLETVYPRPLVLAGVRRDVTKGNYRDAFLTCRKNRIDLNILYDHEPEKFMQNLPTFIEQIEDVDYINLFLGGLKNEDVSRSMYPVPGVPASSSSFVVEGKVNKICGAMLVELNKQMLKYVDSISTAHVVKTPPDYEEALRVLHKLKGQHPKIVEDAVKYVIFLADVNQLFDVALGMYDFQLVLMIAQFSQKDPREYLPFLKELRALDRYYQRFRIDDHLERRASALKNLHLAGPDRFDEAVAYVEKYDLHKESISIWANDADQLKVMYEVYGEHLYDKREFSDAAIVFTLALNTPRAMKAYEKAHLWKELFTLAFTEGFEDERVVSLCQNVCDYLESRGRNVEAGRIWLDYGHNLDQAVHAFCKGRDFSEAYRVTALHKKPELVQSTIHPLLSEAQNVIMEDLKEIEEQMEKQVDRLQELKVLRTQQPDAFFMQDDPALENIDVMTDATQATAFTRYTVAPSTVLTRMTGMTGMTKASSSKRSKRKNERKKAGGRKGTVDEEMYLLGSFSRLVEKFKALIPDVTPVLNHLLISVPHRPEGIELQQAMIDLEERLRVSVEVAWSTEGEAVPPPAPEPIPEVKPTKPTIGDWKGGNRFMG